jgi:DNA repair photolyase
MDMGKHVSISNSSDPYTPQEKELGLTRETLRLLLSRGIKVQLITKSDLVVRDLDIICRGNCAVSLTITIMDKGVAAKLEPGAPPPEERIKALKLLSDAGVPTTARIDPIVPRINDEGLEELVKTVCSAGARHVVASTYKAKADSFNRLVKAFPTERENLWRLFWIEGERLGGTRYLAGKLRRELLTRVRDVVVAEGVTLGVCREGFPEFVTSPTCDGSHLIPERKRKV